MLLYLCDARASTLRSLGFISQEPSTLDSDVRVLGWHQDAFDVAFRDYDVQVKLTIFRVSTTGSVLPIGVHKIPWQAARPSRRSASARSIPSKPQANGAEPRATTRLPDGRGTARLLSHDHRPVIGCARRPQNVSTRSSW